MTDEHAPRISMLDRRLAWARLSTAMFGECPELVDIDGYRVLDVLGRGATATVYLAHDPTLEREVAIKLIHRVNPLGPLEARGDDTRTLQEARALAKLSHPGVVAIHHVGELDGQVYIVMERLRGPDLRSWQQGRPWPQVVRMYIELAHALDHAHRHGVVHGDVKPDNVRIDEHGRGRLLDFGLAAAPKSATTGGTPAYVAPEQLAGAPADPRMDQFAWAVALSEALTGLRPRADSLPTWPSEVDAPPSRIAAVLARALRRDPDERWPSLEAAAEALARAASLDAEQRGRELLLDHLDSAWLGAVLQPLRRERVRIRPQLLSVTTTSRQVVELDAIDRVLAHAGLVLLRGDTGAGKTTALLELAELALQRARQDPSALLPVVLNLSSWSTWPDASMRAWLLDAVSVEYGIPSAIVARWLDDGALLLLLDGLDELATARRDACVQALARLRAERLVGLALTCRSGVEPPIDTQLRPTLTIELQPLTPADLRALLTQGGRGELLAALEHTPNLAALLRSPLLVDLALRCADDMPELSANDGDALLRALTRRLLERQLAPLEPARRLQFHRLARLLARQRLSELWIERMQASWLPHARHPRLHVLLSVLVTATLLTLLVALTLVPAAGLLVGLGSAALAGPLLAAFVAAACGVQRIETVERLSWSWARAWANRRRALGQALALATLVSLVASLAWGVGQSSAFVLAIALSNLLGYALLFTLMLGLLGGLAAELVLTPDRTGRVNQGMWASGRNMLLVWVMVASLLAIPLLGLTLVADELVAPSIDGDALALWRLAPRRFFALIAVCAASTLGCVAGLLRGGFAVIQHLVLRAMLARSGELPLRVGRLLELGCSRALLRRMGGGHAFMHAALQDELARDSLTDAARAR